MAIELDAKKRKILIIAIIVLLVGGAASYGIWYLNNQDSQVAPEDSEAGGENNSGGCVGGRNDDNEIAGSEKGGYYCEEGCVDGFRSCYQWSTKEYCGNSACNTSGENGQKSWRKQCCDGTWQNITCPDTDGDKKCDNETERELEAQYCSGNDGANNCGTTSQVCKCESYDNGCGVNCTFPSGTQAKVDQLADDSCSKYIAMCTVNSDGSTSISYEKFGPGQACWGLEDVCKNPVGTPSCGPSTECGNGIVEEGEVCDDGNDIDDDECSNTCQNVATPGTPNFVMTKTGAEACVGDPAAESTVTYTITLTNTGDTVGTVTQVVDQLDATVQEAWINAASLVPSTGATISANTITWDLEVASQTFDAGEQMTFQYTITVPVAGFGDLTNVVTAYVADVGVADATATSTVTVDCEITPPETGILDSMLGRVGVALVLVLGGAFYMYSDSTDRYVLEIAGDKARLKRRRESFEDKIEK